MVWRYSLPADPHNSIKLCELREIYFSVANQNKEMCQHVLPEKTLHRNASGRWSGQPTEGSDGKDCKACGQESCSAYARQIAEDHGFCSDCPWMDNTVREQIEAEFAQRQNLLQQRAEQSQRKKQEF